MKKNFAKRVGFVRRMRCVHTAGFYSKSHKNILKLMEIIDLHQNP